MNCNLVSVFACVVFYFWVKPGRGKFVVFDGVDYEVKDPDRMNQTSKHMVTPIKFKIYAGTSSYCKNRFLDI